MHSAWKKHQDAVFWFDIDLAIKEGLTFYQARSNAMKIQGTLPAYCIPKVVRLKTREVLYEKSYISPRPPPKISLRHDHDWTRGNDELGSTVEQLPVGKLVQQSCGEVQRVKLSKPTQSKPKPICDRSVKPEDAEHVLMDKGKTSRSHEIDEKRSVFFFISSLAPLWIWLVPLVQRMQEPMMRMMRMMIQGGQGRFGPSVFLNFQTRTTKPCTRAASGVKSRQRQTDTGDRHENVVRVLSRVHRSIPTSIKRKTVPTAY